MAVFRFIASIVWEMLSAQFSLQAIVSLITGTISFVALPFSQLGKVFNLAGFWWGLGNACCFVLFGGGNRMASHFIDYETWNAASIAEAVTFFISFIAMLPQIPGKAPFGSPVRLGLRFP
jgi:hypothetical protein